jgi:asparagine synthase (glutamine-hydrolysing)
MCGIAGIINLSGKIQNIPGLVAVMATTLRHRGPDGEGFLFLNGNREVSVAFGKDTPEHIVRSNFAYTPKQSVEKISPENIVFGFAHRRLSIIDISAAGHQPMCDPGKKIWLTYNGEIYNYIELREELKQKGISFHTNTDSEVIIQSYLCWGESCVSRFNGMWSLVIYDSEKNLVFGSRDRVGVKPFYYYMDTDSFSFASEQKALLKLPFLKTGINLEAASAFLAGDIQFIERGEENMFRNIFELMPSQNFKIDLKNGAFSKWNYYTLKTNTSRSSYREERFAVYRDEAEKLLVDSIRLRLRSDVPVGSCLSGGIDSSAIVSVIGKLVADGQAVNLGGKLNVFTLKFDDKKIDETHWAKYVVDQTRAEWNLVAPTSADLLRDLKDMNYAQDIPVCSTGTYGQFQLMRRAKEKGIKVILDGQGGDELFGGYVSYSLVVWKELIKRGKLAEAFSELSAGGNLLFNTKVMTKESLKKRFSSFLPYEVQASFLKQYFPQNKFLNKRMVDTYVKSEYPAKESEVTRSQTLNQALLKDFVNTRLKMYLKYEDRSSMWHSIEARTPFADDHRLVEAVFNVPGVYKIHNGISKHLLREAMRNYLPKPVKERTDKLGFVTPIDKWMSEIKKQCLDLFDDSVQDYIDVKKIKADPDKFFTMRSHAEGVRVFRMVSFAVWKKNFNL